MSEKAKKYAVVLSGCGVFDGSEIHEAVSLLIALDNAGAVYQCFAPNSWQARTVDHYTGQATAVAGDDDNRNVLAESARIARGNIKDLSAFSVRDFDGVLFPGGMGAAMNLSNFAEKGAACDVHEEVVRVLNEAYDAGLVIGAMCIAPAVVARVLGRHHIKITLGSDPQTAAGIEKTGAIHENQPADGVCIDAAHRIFTTPAYMSATKISEVARGAERLVAACTGAGS